MSTGRILLLLIAGLFVIMAVVCHLIAFFTDYWLKSSSTSSSDFLNIGLWDACFNDYVHKHELFTKTYDGCHAISSDYYSTIQPWLRPSWLVACQVLGMISLVLLLLGLVFVFFLFIWVVCKCICGQDEDHCCQRCLIYTAPILFIVAGMFLMMTAMAFADNAFKLQCKDFWVGGDPNSNQLSFSWAFEVAACILAFIAGGLLIWLAVLTGRKNQPYTIVVENWRRGVKWLWVEILCLVEMFFYCICAFIYVCLLLMSFLLSVEIYLKNSNHDFIYFL